MKYIHIKHLREDSDLTQKQLAKHLNIAQRTYSGYENGTRNIPVDVLIKLAGFYQTSTDYLLELTDKREPYPPKK